MAPPPFKNRGNLSLPATFKCGLCGANKPSSEFSKSQLQKWQNKKGNDSNNAVTPEDIGLTCLAHTAGGGGISDRERRCHGPCDRVKQISAFSKNQRNDPEPWCLDCTNWRMEFGGATVPTVDPNSHAMANEIEGIEEVEDTNAVAAPPCDVDDDDYDSDAFKGTENSKPEIFYAYSDDESHGDDDDGDELDEIDDLEDRDELASVTQGMSRLQGFDRETPSEYTTAYGGSTTGNTVAPGDHRSRYGSQSGFGSDSGYPMMASQQQSIMSNQESLVGAYQASIARERAAYARGSTNHTARTPSVLSTFDDNVRTNRLTSAYDVEGSARTGQSYHTAGSRYSSTSLANYGRGRGNVSALPAQVPYHFPHTGRSNLKNSGGRKKGNKWYKGDNRKVFNDKKMPVATNVEDRNEEPHDSDTPDEM